MLSTAEDIIPFRTIAAGDGREVAADAAAAVAVATNTTLHLILTICILSAHQETRCRKFLPRVR